MNRYKIYSGIVAFASLAILTGCDNIAEDDRFIPVERTEAKRKVLIQEFSGVWCTNCPDGAREIQSLQNMYPESFVAVQLQPAGLSLTRPLRGFTLANEEAKEYYDYYGVSALPSAIFDGGAPIADSRLWSSPAIEALEVEAPLSIELKSSFDESTREMTADYNLTFIHPYLDNASVLIWITESHIIGNQVDGSTTVLDYEHNHIFRATTNGIWGDDLGSGFLPEDSKTGTVKFVLDEKWNADNCHVVAFVFNSSSKAVLQCEEIKLK